MSTSKEFANFLEELRKSRNFSREQLTEGIISLRQYYRFINGESSLRNETVSALLDRMEINPFEAYSKYAERENEQHRLLQEVYDLAKSNKYDQALLKFKTIHPMQLTNVREKKLYDFLEIFLLSINDDFDEEITYQEYCELIDYPKVLENNIFTNYELNALVLISEYLVKKNKDYTITNFLYKVLINRNDYYHLHGTDNLINIYANVAKDLGRQTMYTEALDLCEKGIDYSMQTKSFKGLSTLLLTKAITEKHLSLRENYMLTLTRLFSLLRLLDNNALYRAFYNKIESVFNLTESDLIDFKIKK
jgi:hypothetical protein